MLHSIFSTLPLIVCLCWFVIYTLCYKSSDRAKRVMTGFLLICSILYLCHAYYFNDGKQSWVEGLWMLCSLSVYPIYYIYIKQLTSSDPSFIKSLWYLAPALMVAVCCWTGFTELAQWAHKIIFMVEVIIVCWLGSQRLRNFDKLLKEVYADTEDTSTEPLRTLLICFVITSVVSSFFNAIGRQYFSGSVWLLAIPSVIFSAMLFAISYVGYSRRYIALQLNEDMSDGEPEENLQLSSLLESEDNNTDKIKSGLQQAMQERKLFLQPDIKINELAKEIGTCRTYLSSYLNKELGVSFSDYINRQRIEYAQELIKQSPSLTTAELASQSGFASETSFVRNYKKFSLKKSQDR